ncbi:FadR family transcriptional regulator [Acidovorax sp. Be4]|uniref:FadR family transcriptional regulator n=1 Tax=Acidovorax bellezanensis TaxID=2976702 RepID=A0ABT2PLG3_9BURK|nr:FadR/GntR family transcriptional regulator [Acidovorax sp. Be4]MCT9810706.1 FadR family transcriptional regulator [Acidovorax sp. Be4]
MSPPRLRNFHHQIVDAVGASIVAGRYAEGSQLPTEPQLAETYGASRLIIREAMKSLAAKGLVSIRPRTGTHVLPRSEWNLFDPAVLGWQSEAPPDPQLIADLMELRQTIEPLAARLAASRAQPQQVADIREAFEAMAQAQTQVTYIQADLRFHGAVVRSCGNQFIMQLETALSAVWKTSFQASSDAWGPDAQALALHQSLLHAIEAHDPQGAEAAVLALIARAVVRIHSGLA